jgi:hypothetical protein
MVDECEKLLKMDGSMLNKKLNSKDWLPIHVAASYSALKVLDLMLKNGHLGILI